jgi:hypothetical protein
MGFAVVLDASVLYPLPLRDTLLCLAEYDVYAVRWSGRILDELARSLIADGRATPEQAESLIGAMRRTFWDAEIPDLLIAAHEPAMTNEPSDRHVLAAAAASEDARAIACEPVR